jgi:hypothetical protein
MRLGLGDAQCGDNPCGMSDFLGPSQECMDYTKCVVKETAAASFTPQVGGIPVTTLAYGGGVVADEAAKYAAGVISDAVAAGVSGGTGLPPGTTGNSLLSIGLIAGAALLGILFLTRR